VREEELDHLLVRILGEVRDVRPALDRLKKIAYHSLDDQGGVSDRADAVTFYYDRYPYASLFGTPVEAEKYVLNDQANQHLIERRPRRVPRLCGKNQAARQ